VHEKMGGKGKIEEKKARLVNWEAKPCLLPLPFDSWGAFALIAASIKLTKHMQ
jgi:hypothetical protein